jgi:hypothetical protein
MKTVGTYPPEGSHAALGRGHSVPVRQWPIVAVLLIVAIGLAVTALGSFRPGVITIGAGLLFGAGLRFWRPEVGLLAVRSRYTDVSVLGVMGLVIVLLALAAQPDPIIQWSILRDVSGWLGRSN